LPTRGAHSISWALHRTFSVAVHTRHGTEYGLGPAAIAREPLFSQPLAKNARWHTLVSRLETEIAENRALL